MRLDSQTCDTADEAALDLEQVTVVTQATLRNLARFVNPVLFPSKSWIVTDLTNLAFSRHCIQATGSFGEAVELTRARLSETKCTLVSD